MGIFYFCGRKIVLFDLSLTRKGAYLGTPALIISEFIFALALSLSASSIGGSWLDQQGGQEGQGGLAGQGGLVGQGRLGVGRSSWSQYLRSLHIELACIGVFFATSRHVFAT